MYIVQASQLHTGSAYNRGISQMSVVFAPKKPCPQDLVALSDNIRAVKAQHDKKQSDM